MNTLPHRTRRTTLAALLLAATTVAPHSDAAENVSADVRALREQIAALDQQLRVLERKQELRDEENAAAAARVPVVAAAASGFSITSGDKRFNLRLRGNVHADARFFIGDDIAGNDQFLLRRVRPSLEGTVAEKYSFRIMPDFAGSSFTLLDAYGSYKHSDALNILVGKTKAPFDFERLVSQTDLLFVERAYPTTLGPNRDIGVQVFGDLAGGRLSYQAAWLNGTADNASSVTDDADDKDLVLRLFAHPFKDDADSAWKGLGFGVAVSKGTRTGTPAGYRTNAQQTFFSWRSGAVSDGSHTRVEPQAYYYRGPLGLIGSWVSSRQDIVLGTSSAELTNTAWYLAAHWVLTGEDATYRGVTPRNSFSWKDGTWGAWEIAARIGELSIDDDAFPVFANPATSASKVRGYTLGVNWYLNRNLKGTLNFEHSDFTGGASGAVTREDENAILSRLQIRF
ncbi:OprO/OprP family phosphate-selective porin [Congregicoccus parvus]|uniref:OprO/OprP family phosphate-selective porin n=1 Tax=Congregicoccus parvus TaxID=3081749 RepID=UPI003FA5EBE6